eukprot:4823571-Pleurochrysis_carterae.AAC.1
MSPPTTAVDGSHSSASSKRLVSRGGGTNLSASSNIEDIIKIPAGTYRSLSFLIAIEILMSENLQ